MHARATWPRALGVVAAVCAGALVAGCKAGRPESATQVAAKVNREEISLLQVNYFLQRQGPVAPDELEAQSRRTLESLVDQEVAVQAAVDQRLDRDPTVLQALDAARREVLARAYAERLMQSVTPPDAGEVQRYYDAHPALFSKRRYYTLVDTAVQATPEQQAAVQAQLPTTRGAADVGAVLRQAQLKHASRRAVLGAESLPLQAVDNMAALREGQSLLVGGPRDAHIYTVVEAEQAPLGVDEARAGIVAFLTAERRRQWFEQQIKALRSTARIEYRGRFAQAASSAVSGASGATPAAALPAATTAQASIPHSR